MYSASYYCQILRKLDFPGNFSKKKKKLQTPNFMEIRPVGAELFHAEGRTGMTKHFALKKALDIKTDWLTILQP
jgi:hypothetical protein